MSQISVIIFKLRKEARAGNMVLSDGFHKFIFHKNPKCEKTLLRKQWRFLYFAYKNMNERW